MGRSSKRDQLLDTAEELFARDGYVATGINQITEEAGVATMTLYNNFANKEELIAAMLERRAQRFIQEIEQQIAEVSEDPYEQILAIFDDNDQWIRSEFKTDNGFSGCAFIKASIEFNSPTHSAHAAALNQKKYLLKLFERLLKKAGYSKTRERALELHLLLDGSITQAQVLHSVKSARRARSMAEKLLAYK